ncbi:ATP-binding protein [Citromicrobium bathyomarinum]|uniref:sensor histidine kinase n=1 Tax=Citromicrobium bathyomarinum TaxID=72174 RepID=UPI003159DEB3
MTARGWFLAIVFCVVATAASSFRIVLAPGFELYLGPLFYLLAYRIGGLRLALPMVVLTMGASVLWWGHVFTMVMAFAHVVFVDRVRFLGRSLAIATVVFFLTIGALAAYLFLHFHYGASPTIIALAIIRKVINEALMAALVDLAMSLLAVNLRAGRVSRQRTFSLSELLPASIMLIVLTSALVLFVGSVQKFPQDFRAFQAETGLQVDLRIGRGIFREEPFLGLAELTHAGITRQKVLISEQESSLRSPAAMAQFGCERIDDGSQVTGPNDRNTFAYWVSACQLAQTEIAGGDYYYLFSTRPLAEQAYRGVLVQMIAPGVLLAFAILLQLFLTRALNRSLRAWKDVAEGFGRPGLSAPGELAFTEFDRPIAAIVAANNSFAGLVEERARIASAVEELKTEMDLSLAANIFFDAETSTLHFQDVSLDRVAQDRSEKVHPNDCMVFAEMRNAAETFIEFRLAGDDKKDWYLLVARDLRGPGKWRSGWMVRLRQSKLAQNRMLQQARLTELGGMASALSHELKQPLFTISLCAENGRLLLDQEDDDGVTRARGKLDRISEQVDRARDIIARISRYTRIEDSDPEPLDLGDAIGATLSFMRPLLVQHDVGVQVTMPDGPAPSLLAPRVGLEQVMVNAIQNSVDSIATRRENGENSLTGAIAIGVSYVDGGLRISIRDNGTGVSLTHSENAFDAFATTKDSDRGTGLGLYISRQIIMEIGGKIAIASRELPERGAIVTIDFPKFVVVTPDAVRKGRPMEVTDG